MLDISQRLEKLPILPDKVNILLDIKNSKNYDSKKLSQLIEYDSILSTRVLQLANSEHFGFPNRIYSATQASSLFGMNFTIGVCVSELVLNSLRFNLKPYGIQIGEFNRLNDFLLKLIFSILEEKEASLKESLIIPLFLKDIGKFLISDYLIQSGKTNAFQSSIKHRNIYETEESLVGIKSNELTAKILRKWGITEPFVDTIDLLSKENTTKESRVLSVINSVGNFTKPFGQDNISNALILCENYGLNTTKLKEKVLILQKQYNF
ncbi:HDOD domain-containing protein [Arcobacter sp. YIC-464]|uniref:HDOD domain-containing protein n=1 Tax=Arcobacter sp. YIC-464 TaxID=3376631 RepID=UPI003C14AB30